VLPVVLMDALVGSFGANAMFMGLVYGVVGAKLGGTHRMLSHAPLVGFAAGVGACTAYGWLWVLLLAFLGVVAGVGMRWGVVATTARASFRGKGSPLRCRRVDTPWSIAPLLSSARTVYSIHSPVAGLKKGRKPVMVIPPSSRSWSLRTEPNGG
jgi:hypothetical protein